MHDGSVRPRNDMLTALKFAATKIASALIGANHFCAQSLLLRTRSSRTRHDAGICVCAASYRGRRTVA